MVYNPSNPKSINREAFKGGYIENYRLVKLKLLLESPKGRIKDLEDRVSSGLAGLTDTDREELTEKVYRGLYKIALQFCKRKAEKGTLRKTDIEDVAENCTLMMISRIPSYKPISDFLGWVYTIIHNYTIDILREYNGTKTFSEIKFNEELKSDQRNHSGNNHTRNAVTHAMDAKKSESIESALSDLNEREKQVLTFVANDVPYREIADYLSISEGNAQIIMLRIRRKLQPILLV